MYRVTDVAYKFIEVGMRSVARTTIFTMQARTAWDSCRG